MYSLRILIIISIFIYSFQASAQVAGTEIYQFLNVSTSARQIALGGETLTLMDDVNQPIWNPATINASLDNQLSANYSNFLAGISMGSVSYAKMFTRRFGTMHGNITYLNYGTLISADENGNELGTFNASDVAISIGYAVNLPWTNFYFGTNVRLINSNIDNFSSTGITSDLSILYYSPYKPYVITAVVRNLGTQISTFNGIREDIPLRISLGASYQLEYVPLRWYITLDNLQQWDLSEPNPSNGQIDLEGNLIPEEISFFANTLRHFTIGGELFPDSGFNLRFGYNFRRAAELQLQNVRTFAGASFGFGIKMNKIKFNYAYSSIHSATNTSTFSLLIDLDKS